MTDREKSFELSQSDFNFICQYTYEIAGIVLNASKKEMVYRRLTRIIRARNIASFTEYCDLLKSEPEKEKDYFINAITTNLTNFFREQHHFDYMLQHELPKIIENSLTNYKRLRIWSSASSTGEEPYSIAITILEGMKNSLDQWDVKILATDIDSDALAVGKIGVYDNHRIEDIPNKIREKYFHKGIGENKNKVKVDGKLGKLITFKQLNLLCDWPMKGPFDIIFCRNVIIYFDKETQQKLFARYHEMLAPGGLLILGHSENLGTHQVHFENIGRTIYRKLF
jgi:chemotaxis protein methyltransferase CheR